MALLVAAAAGLSGCAEGHSWDPGQDGGDSPRDDGGTVEGTGDGTTGEDGTSPADAAAGDDGEATDITCATLTFAPTETQEHFIPPAGVRYMHVKAWGGGANGETLGCGFDDSGLGGFTEAVFELATALPPLIVIVGGPGSAGRAGTMEFGWGSDGGGGLSGVFVGPETITENDMDKALVIAGGGGGAWPGCNAGGTGNHLTYAGGQPNMLGGLGRSGDIGVNGGGGGLSGGTGGARREVGKGGTGFVDDDRPGLILRYSDIVASEPGAGVPPHSTDDDYRAGAGTGEQPGQIVIYLTCEPPPFI
jgi:hypothetical protein